VDEHAQRLHDVLQVEQRLAHAHEDHVREGLAVGVEQLAGVQDLVDDLLGAQVAAQTELAGGAEGAVQAAADLRRHAQGLAALLRDQHRLDARAVGRGQHELARAVAGFVHGHALERARAPLRGELRTQARRQVGHAREVAFVARVQPARQLRRAEAGEAVRDEARAQLVRGEREQGVHGALR
jgi:hypothetical protein